MKYYNYIHNFPWHILVDYFPEYQVPVMALVCKDIREALVIAKRDVHKMPLWHAIQSKKYLDRAITILGFSKKYNKIYEKIIKAKDPDILFHAIKLGCFYDFRECWIFAIENGRIDILKNIIKKYPIWMDDFSMVYGVGSCGWAAWHNQLEIVKWLRNQSPKCPWGTVTCLYAAKAGNLHILKWLREQTPPCPWDENVCKYAVGGGHLNILKWARAQVPPCPWGYCTILWSKNNTEILTWILKQKPPCPLPPKYLFDLKQHLESLL